MSEEKEWPSTRFQNEVRLSNQDFRLDFSKEHTHNDGSFGCDAYATNNSGDRFKAHFVKDSDY